MKNKLCCNQGKQAQVTEWMRVPLALLTAVFVMSAPQAARADAPGWMRGTLMSASKMIPISDFAARSFNHL
jgi:hypothetical protein